MPRFAPLSAHRRWIVGVILMAGLAVSWIVWQVAEHNEDLRIGESFRRRAEVQLRFAQQRLHLYNEMIHSLRNFFYGQRIVTRDEFHLISQDLLQRYPAVQALQWVPLVPADRRDAFERNASREHGRPFVITERDAAGRFVPAAVRPEHTAILFTEPMAGNSVVVGYDILTAPTAPALLRARTTRELVVTPQFRLAQSDAPADEFGLVFIMPVFAPAVEGGPSMFLGFVQSVFRVETMLAHAHRARPDEALLLYYVDLDAGAGAPAVLYASEAGREPLREGRRATLETPRGQPGDFQEILEIGGRRWLLLIRMSQAWHLAQHSAQPRLLFGGGLALTLLAALLVNMLIQRTRLIEAEVTERTAELETARRLLEDDIRRRTAAEQALKASESRLQDIVDHSPTIIFLKDNDGRYLLCNQAFVDYCGRPRSAILGRRDEDLFSADDARRCRENDERVRSAGRPLEFEEYATSAANPNTYLALKFPLRDDAGRIYALCGISTDISERKQAEQDKIAMERKLLAAQKLESLGVLAGGIAHDFNNILTSVLANASLARHDAASGRSVERNLTQIELAARRAADLCQQMLAYAGKGKLASDHLDLSELVRGTAALLEVTISKNTRLDLRLADGLPPVLADSTQLRQIVMNLVINAADAITGRPGLITVTTFTREADADLLHSALGNPDLPPGTYVGLEVSDNGSGMAPETVARIFEPFFTTKFSGRGLGLSAVLGIVQGHRGALFVESTPGRGSAFRLLLPATSGRTVASAPPFPDAGPVALRGTVLVVDDEEAVRSIAATVLEMHGAASLTAASGDEALELLRARGEQISLVLLDLTMPGLNGEETLRRMRMLGARQPVILMSGYSETETMLRSTNLGIAGFIQKPFEVTTLLAKAKPFLA